MLAISLQSGSNGNCIYVETGGVKLLFDAGIPGVAAERRLQMRGRDIRGVDALIISHDHGDHIRHAGVFQRKYGIPVHVSPATFEVAARKMHLGKFSNIKHFSPGRTLGFGSVTVESIPTCHDAAEGSVFVVCSEGKRLGVITDVGHAFVGLADVLESLDGVFIESNYDPVMLERGRYPVWLKDRIMGPSGHISNHECAELLRRHGKRLDWACLSHLSENNNTPALALRTVREVVGDALPLHLASRYGPTDMLRI
jgi:phosphoribosyl 1,2-cyclic phosphodiesterase